MTAQVVDEHEHGFGWIEETSLRRTAHALVADGRVWLVDPFDADGVDERMRSLGEPAGVIQLLNRHERDGAALAARLGVPLHAVPSSLPESPFRLLPVARNRLWREVALWWPEHRILVCADAIGTIPFFCAGDEPAGVHPLLRLAPPRALAGLDVRRLLVGHGEGVHGEAAAEATESAIRTARRRLPRLLAGMPRALRSYG